MKWANFLHATAGLCCGGAVVALDPTSWWRGWLAVFLLVAWNTLNQMAYDEERKDA